MYMFCFKQAVFQDEETVDESKFKLSRSKVHKSFRARPVAVKKDYGYMTAMVEDVLSSVPDLKQSMDMTLDRSHIIFQKEQFSRFK